MSSSDLGYLPLRVPLRALDYGELLRQAEFRNRDPQAFAASIIGWSLASLPPVRAKMLSRTRKNIAADLLQAADARRSAIAQLHASELFMAQSIRALLRRNVSALELSELLGLPQEDFDRLQSRAATDHRAGEPVDSSSPSATSRPLPPTENT